MHPRVAASVRGTSWSDHPVRRYFDATIKIGWLPGWGQEKVCCWHIDHIPADRKNRPGGSTLGRGNAGNHADSKNLDWVFSHETWQRTYPNAG